MDKYLKAIQDRVCAVCIDGVFNAENEFVRCGLPKHRTCPVERHLPQVVKIVQDIDSPVMDDYIDALHDQICSDCEQTTDGMCDFRLKAQCPLDTYFMLITEAVEGVNDREP